MGTATEGRVGPIVEEPRGEHLLECGKRLEIGVVAAGLPRERDMHGMVEIVAPLGIQPIPGRARDDQLRVVEV